MLMAPVLVQTSTSCEPTGGSSSVIHAKLLGAMRQRRSVKRSLFIDIMKMFFLFVSFQARAFAYGEKGGKLISQTRLVPSSRRSVYDAYDRKLSGTRAPTSIPSRASAARPSVAH